MTTLPLWALYLVSFGTPIAAFVGVIVGQPVEEIEEATGEVDVIEIDNPAQYWGIEQQEPQSREPQGE